jgi:hypothetical protein
VFYRYRVSCPSVFHVSNSSCFVFCGVTGVIWDNCVGCSVCSVDIKGECIVTIYYSNV